jgi:hypothetical protein
MLWPAQRVLPLYFPRNKQEEQAAIKLLPDDTGNELGESVIQERQIRISAMPGASPLHRGRGVGGVGGDVARARAAAAGMSGTDDLLPTGHSPRVTYKDRSASEAAPVDEEQKSAPRRRCAPPVANARPCSRPGSSFTAPSENPDDVRRKIDQSKPRSQQEREEAERRYQIYLRRAKEEDLSHMAALKFIYISGEPRRPAAPRSPLWSAQARTRWAARWWLSSATASRRRPSTWSGRCCRCVAARRANRGPPQEQIMLYMIQLLDTVVERDYTVVYTHTNIEAHNKPPTKWLKEVYDIFNRKYKKNMKRMFIVHPSFWVK